MHEIEEDGTERRVRDEVEGDRAAYLRKINRSARLYTAACGVLMFAAMVAFAGVYRLAYDVGHVRSSWAALILAVTASVILGGLGWLAGSEAEKLGERHRSLVRPWWP
jgi:hypothetical protein